MKNFLWHPTSKHWMYLIGVFVFLFCFVCSLLGICFVAKRLNFNSRMTYFPECINAECLIDDIVYHTPTRYIFHVAYSATIAYVHELNNNSHKSHKWLVVSGTHLCFYLAISASEVQFIFKNSTVTNGPSPSPSRDRILKQLFLNLIFFSKVSLANSSWNRVYLIEIHAVLVWIMY